MALAQQIDREAKQESPEATIGIQKENGEKAVSDPDPDPDPVADRLLILHNERRQEKDLPPLSLAGKLSEAARIHAQDMAKMGNLTHQGSDGSKVVERVRRLSYVFQNVGENVAYGQESPEAVMQGWMESPKHQENILGDFEEMGAAQVADEAGRPYWCVTFGTPLPQLDPAEASAELLRLINQRRAKENLPEIQVSKTLSTVAQDHAGFMAKSGGLRQEGPDGQTPFERLHAMDYKFRKIALSVGSGQPRPRAMLDNLLNDPEQRRNVLGKFNRIGISYANAEDGTPYWTILFAEVPTSNGSQ